MKWYYLRNKEGTGVCGPTSLKYPGLRYRVEPCYLCKKASGLRTIPTHAQLYGVRPLPPNLSSPYRSSDEDDEGDECDEDDEDDEYISI